MELSQWMVALRPGVEPGRRLERESVGSSLVSLGCSSISVECSLYRALTLSYRISATPKMEETQ
ncbi:unnamed protein product [Cuscuta europaea]|uniref:Uncharacterized protein n=1 Tax=Cuscuta europaea TaxID=41803 RepID=A0A9P0ZGF6_CUSEU|nr:unnamed protein product [Cuscuta europaea]